MRGGFGSPDSTEILSRCGSRLGSRGRGRRSCRFWVLLCVLLWPIRVVRAYLLLLLGLLRRRGVSLQHDLLPLRRCLELGLDRRHELDKRIGHRRFEYLRSELEGCQRKSRPKTAPEATSAYNVILVVVLNLLDGRVDKRLQTVSLPINCELLLARLQLRGREQDVLQKPQDTVALDDLGRGLSLADLASYDILEVEQIDLRV